jgi:hypothetical protein
MPYKKCPPGVICVENFTIILIIVVIVAILYLLNRKLSSNETVVKEKIVIQEEPQRESQGWFNYFTRPNSMYTNLPQDVLMNPYAPPLKDDGYIMQGPNLIPPGRIPVNVSTNVGAVDTSYRQLGILTPVGGDKSKILPLMGRPLFVNRNKYQYYTMSDQNNSIKLPVVKNGKSCTNEYGCDEVYNGDSVYVQGYNQAFRATLYDNDTIKYLPYL